MTTRLAGTATHFLPFNKGCDGGAGNPPDPAGRTYRTAYLWEEVLQRDSLLDLLARFIHLQVEEKRDDQGRKVKTESMIFPRYHQLQAVRMLVEAARSEGVGHNYLVEHSAGSGKSNTIGWLTHRLASLHDACQPASLRQRDRGDGSRGARPAAAGHDLPVRAQTRGRSANRRELAAARRGARECSAGDHHDAAEVPVRLPPVAQDGRGTRRRPARERSPPDVARSSSTRPTARRAARRRRISRKCSAARGCGKRRRSALPRKAAKTWRSSSAAWPSAANRRT